MATASTHPALAELRQSGATKVKVAVSDIDGILRGKFLHIDKFEGAAEGGFGFCDVVFGWDAHDVTYDNTNVTGWQHGYPDALARVDLDTFRRVPWDDDVPFFLGEFVDAQGGPFPVCPRQTLKRVLARAAKLGLQPMCGMEFEWFNFRETPHTWAAKNGAPPEPITPGMFGYSLLRMADNPGFFNALMDDMLAFKVPIEGLHTETGPGVYEAAIANSVNPDGRVNEASLRKDLDFFRTRKEFELAPNASVESAIDNSFVDNAVKVLGPYKPKGS